MTNESKTSTNEFNINTSDPDYKANNLHLLLGLISQQDELHNTKTKNNNTNTKITSGVFRTNKRDATERKFESEKDKLEYLKKTSVLRLKVDQYDEQDKELAEELKKSKLYKFKNL